jgi:ATP-dependent DNA helicase DinG
VRSFDPDEEGLVDEVEGPGVELDADLVEVDEGAALALLERVTADLPGGGEVRDAQRTMVSLVAAAWSRGRHVVIEAGTGVGKSLGYLVPAALLGERVVVATATKNLQDQLATKDAPLVAAHRPGLRVATLKGRASYLCRQRAFGVGTPQQLELDQGEPVPRGVATQIRRVLRWMSETETGDRDEVPFEVEDRAWRALSVTPQECVGRAQCPQGANCFAEAARDRASAADIVVVNTHLYAAHLASGSMLLPAHRHVVFDEAHEVRDIMATLLGTSVTATRARALAASARAFVETGARERIDDLVACADRLAAALEAQWAEGRASGLDEGAARELERLRELVTALTEALRTRPAERGAELRHQRALGSALQLGQDLARLTRVGEGELVYLTRREREVAVELSLVEVATRLADELWDHVSAVLTSATIPESLPRDLGLGEVALERLPSPFDFRSQALLYVPAGIPARNDPGAEAAIIEELVALIEAAGGRTLALFTNREVMRRVAAAVGARVTTPVLVQGELSRAATIAAFRDEEAASLFAVTSFWQGVDVPGRSLSVVAIDRLPFQVPGDPLAEARRSLVEAPFVEVDLPRATMLLAQGVGRLIRSATDKGVVAVLDTRLAEASYRSRMLRALPAMRRTRDRADVVAFLRSIDIS